MGAIDIGYRGLSLSYLMLIFPFALIMWYRLSCLSDTIVSIIRMTIQLLFVGLYLQVLFEWNNIWLNLAWLSLMIAAADVSILRSSGLKLKRFIGPLFLSLIIGTWIPLLFFVGVILHRPNLMDAQYAIPIAGMILGNCLRADIVGIRTFYESIKKDTKQYHLRLAYGASLKEAIRPYLRDSFHISLAPTIASMSTIGLVALPGMMTGVILGGTDPAVAIKYQIAIMIAIFSGTAITVSSAILLTLRESFTPFGTLDQGIFSNKI